MARWPQFVDLDSPVPPLIRRHMQTMGFSSPHAYLGWCWENGFEPTFLKSRMDLQAERDTFNAAAEIRRKHNRLHKNPKAFLKAVCRGELTSDDIDRPNYKRTAQEIEVSNELEEARESLLEMLSILVKHHDLIFGAVSGQEDLPLIRGLIKLRDRKVLWLRDLESWKPKSKNVERQFGELTHHLFDKFGDVPVFMESAWLRNDRSGRRFRDWYVHLGRGHNLRTAKCPVNVTKMVAHEFSQAPADFTIEQAVRWGQLRAFGASRNTIDAVVATRLGRSFANEEFWVTVLRFFAENQMLDPRQIGPIIDYLQNQRFEPTEVEVAPGQWRQRPPRQPRLSMQGRTVNTLLRQVEAWHRGLGKLQGLPSDTYAKAGVEGIAIERGQGRQTVRWAIRQLRNAKELRIEGDELRHCVASYHRSCVRGECTIWSLSRSEDDNSYERRQTIEVDKYGTIVQCRGLANRDPSRDEWSIVTEWAREANLRISSYL